MHTTLQYIQRILHSESNSTCRRQRALRVLLLHSRGQRDLHFQKRNSTHRRQGDLLEMHPCVTRTLQAFSCKTFQRHPVITDIPVFPDIPDIPVFPVFPDIPDTPETFQTFQSFMTFQPFQAILQCSSISRESNPFQHSPIRMHILHILHILRVLQILQFDWFPQKKLYRVQVEQLQTFYKHSFFKEREML